MLTKPLLLVLIPMTADSLERVRDRFDVLYAPDDAQRAAQVAARGADVQAVLTIGTTGLSAAEIDAMPRLGLVCALGAGHENIDSAHARQRGIVVANGAGTNDDCVADHAMALLLATVRRIPQFDAACRAGKWRTELPSQPVVLTPHVAGTSPETATSTLQRFLDNAERHFAGLPVVSPV